MIICHQCQKSQPEGTIFCSECGTKLIDTIGKQTQSFTPQPELADLAAFPTVDLRHNGADQESQVSLHILKTDDRIPLVGQDDFTIGRMSEGQSIIPDIDLSPFNAYQEGVSRIHASIKVNENEVSLIDLNSINGTSINDAKIPPNVYYDIKNGDTVTLGRLKVQIIIGDQGA